jgi:CrcB protein
MSGGGPWSWESAILYLWVGLGSALGGMSRYFVSGWVAVRWGETFPLGTLVVNVTGSFVIGFLALMAAGDGRMLLSPTARTFLIIGFLGGYTTFSSFSLQTLLLARDGEWLYAFLNIAGSVVLCLFAVYLGAVTAAWLNRLA